MKKIIILGCLGFDLSIMAQRNLNNNVEIVTNNIDAKNMVNFNIEREPIVFNSHYQEVFDIKQTDIPRNKFLDKPRHNYRRR